eukprot:gene5161-8767_t
MEEEKIKKFDPKVFVKRTTPNIVMTTLLGSALMFNRTAKRFSKFSNFYIFLRTANTFAIPSTIFFSSQEILREYKGEHSLIQLELNLVQKVFYYQL